MSVGEASDCVTLSPLGWAILHLLLLLSGLSKFYIWWHLMMCLFLLLSIFTSVYGSLLLLLLGSCSYLTLSIILLLFYFLYFLYFCWIPLIFLYSLFLLFSSFEVFSLISTYRHYFGTGLFVCFHDLCNQLYKCFIILLYFFLQLIFFWIFLYCLFINIFNTFIYETLYFNKTFSEKEK